MKLMIAAAVLGGATLAPSAMAQEAQQKFYWWAGYGKVAVEDDLGVTAEIGAVQGKLGYRFSPYFGVEGEAAFGVATDRLDLGMTVDAGLDRAFGVYGVAFLPVGQFDLFARAGIAAAELEATVMGITSTAEDDGAAFGGGLIWNVGPIDLRGEYTLYNFDGNSDAVMVSIGGKF